MLRAHSGCQFIKWLSAERSVLRNYPNSIFGQRVDNVGRQSVRIAKRLLVDRVRDDAFDGWNAFRHGGSSSSNGVIGLNASGIRQLRGAMTRQHWLIDLSQGYDS